MQKKVPTFGDLLFLTYRKKYANTYHVDLPLQVLIYYLNTITILDHKRIGLGEEPVKSELF